MRQKVNGTMSFISADETKGYHELYLADETTGIGTMSFISADETKTLADETQEMATMSFVSADETKGIGR
jgi:hypothetical protein